MKNYLVPLSAGIVTPRLLTKCAQSVLSKRSASSLKCHFEKVAGEQKCEPKSLKDDVSPEIQESLRRWQTTQLEGTIHRPGADLGAGFGLEFLHEFSKTCRTDRHPAPVAARSRSQTRSLFRRRSLSASEWPAAVSGQCARAAFKTQRPTGWVKAMSAKMKTPRSWPAFRGVGEGSIRAIDERDYSSRSGFWWGRQACSCYGEGRCLCCRRFDRAISADVARVAHREASQ